MLGNDADAHEVVHDLFVSLLEEPRQYAGRGELTAFLHAAIRHACLNRLRNQRTRLELLKRRHVEPELQHGCVQPEVRATVLSLLQSMPWDVATTAVYRHVAGLTHDEIAVLMRCSPRRIGNLLTQMSAWATRNAELQNEAAT
jgi:RNA polymerase sigma-70 factor (ECF subfamily)